VIVRPAEIESASADKPQVSFERVGEQHFLTRIRTSRDVFNIAISRSAILEAAARSLGNTASSERSGAN
jgi:hypothetical protein